MASCLPLHKEAIPYDHQSPALVLSVVISAVWPIILAVLNWLADPIINNTSIMKYNM